MTAKNRIVRVARVERRRRRPDRMTTFCYRATTDQDLRRRQIHQPFDHEQVFAAIAAGAANYEGQNTNPT